jgi:hypothetical protein
MSVIEPSGLALFWAAVIAASILVYVILDGFDLGVGILFGTTRGAALRDEMMRSRHSGTATRPGWWSSARRCLEPSPWSMPCFCRPFTYRCCCCCSR